MRARRLDTDTGTEIIAAVENGRSRAGAIVVATIVFLLLLPNLAYVVVAPDSETQVGMVQALARGLLPSTFVVLALMAAAGSRTWLAVALLTPVAAFIAAETAYVVHFGSPSTYGIIATIAESNRHEMLDYLGSTAWLLVAGSVLCTGFFILAAIYLRRTAFSWNKRLRERILMVAAISLVTVLIFAAPEWLEGAQITGGAESAKHHLPSDSWPAWTDNFESSFPVGLPFRAAHYLYASSGMRRQADVLKDFRFGARAGSVVAGRQIFVLVIGETGRRDRWHFFGYDRETTPHLDQQSNLIGLKNLITPTSASRTSVPIIVSRKPASDSRDFFDEKSISEAFKEAGFQTYWFSNQIPVGPLDSPIANVAFDAEHVAFLNFVDWSKPGTFDEVLLPPLQDAIANGGDRIFVVLHTLGSHADYALRYPDTFDIFRPSFKGHPGDYKALAEQESTRNSYDNSILYTDYFLWRVIQQLEASGAVATMWYTSDHGEDFVSPTCNLFSHGSSTVHNFELPSVFWFSDSYAQRYADKIGQMRAHAASPLTTEYMFESMIDMAGLDFPNHDQSRSVFSDKLTLRPRITRAFVVADYDTSARSKGCQMLLPQ